MRRWLYTDSAGRTGSVGLLLLRLAFGIAFVIHGWSKIQNPLAWMGAEAKLPESSKPSLPSQNLAAAWPSSSAF